MKIKNDVCEIKFRKKNILNYGKQIVNTVDLSHGIRKANIYSFVDLLIRTATIITNFSLNVSKQRAEMQHETKGARLFAMREQARHKCRYNENSAQK